MPNRKKRLVKQEKGLLKQMEKHLKKLEKETGKKDTTHAYWMKEIRQFENLAKQRTTLLRNPKRKKRF